MTFPTPQPSLEDVLDAFAVEPDPGRQTLERYLRDYPRYAADLIDFSRELSRSVFEDEEPLSSEDQLLIDEAWQRHLKTTPEEIPDPFASLSVEELREIAGRLEVPRQVVTAFRQRRVIISTVPRRFLSRLATAMSTTVERLVGVLELPPVPSPERSYKADSKLGVDASVTFEQILMDAGVSDQKRTALLADDD